jgi:biopolymer transport protein ExbD
MKLDFESRADDVRIDLIPLIDVVFCILIFFMLASLQLTRQQAISINLPQSSTSALQTHKSLVVSIDSSGTIYVDQQPVTQDNLYYTMQGFEKENPEGLMVLYADRSATYDSVIQLLDLMRSVGGDRVALATQQPQPGSGQPLIPGLTPGGAGQQPPGAGLGFPIAPTTPGLSAPAADPFADPAFVAPSGSNPTSDLPGGGTPNGGASSGGDNSVPPLLQDNSGLLPSAESDSAAPDAAQ